MISEYLIGGLVTWLIVYEVFYSPKAQVKRLWKKCFRIAAELSEIRERYPGSVDILKPKYEAAIEKQHKIINALLDYYFDPEEDSEYMKENRAFKNQ